MSGDFTIGALAQRTGVTPNVLRTWDNRFGFPAGRRTPSGHRRFTEDDVTLVAEVQAARQRGVPLHVAIDAVLHRSRQERADSVHATLTREFPDLRTQRLGKAMLLAASHAIEDESLARAERSIVLGTFQEGHLYERSRHRWDELARTATWSAVLADFDESIRPDPEARPSRCQLSVDSPLRREWTVVTLSPTFAAVLAAWQVPTVGGLPHVYESLVTTRRAAVVAAARVIVGAARSAGATPPQEVVDVLGDAPMTETSVADADRMWLRALANAEG